MIIRGSLRTVLLIAVVLMGLGACSNGSVPPRQTSTGTVTPTATSVSPSASPTPSLPAAAQQPTRAGAEAFARYFFAVYNYAFWNADPAPLRAISVDECVFCRSTIDAVISIREEKARADGGQIDVLAALASPGQPVDRTVVNVSLHQHAGRTVSTAGQTLDTAPERRNGRIDLVLRWADGHWTVLEADVIRDVQS